MERNEDITDTARREVFEEVGLTLLNLRLVDVLKFEHTYGNGDTKIIDEPALSPHFLVCARKAG